MNAKDKQSDTHFIKVANFARGPRIDTRHG
jgi:hypothetical protein